MQHTSKTYNMPQKIIGHEHRVCNHCFTYAIQEESQWERTSLQSPENVTPIEKTQRKRLNATAVLENATQGRKHEFCRRISGFLSGNGIYVARRYFLSTKSHMIAENASQTAEIDIGPQNATYFKNLQYTIENNWTRT